MKFKPKFFHLFSFLISLILIINFFVLPVQASQTGNVIGFGVNSSGQLGIGTIDFNAHTMPIQANINDVISVTSGTLSSFAIKSDGTLWAWGDNSLGQLGDNTTINRASPVQVVDSDGIGFLSNVKAVSSNSYHTLALKSDGAVWAWGSNNNGELGDGTAQERNMPVQVVGESGIGVLSDIVSIGTGMGYSIALKQDGTVWTWGSNNKGQLGNYRAGSSTPVQVLGSDGSGNLTNIIAIAAGERNNVVLKSDGTVWAWGLNANGQLGNGTTTNSYVPVQVVNADDSGTFTGVSAISAGRLHNIALKNDGTVWAWGFNHYGSLGIGSVYPTNSLIPIQVKDPTGTSFLTNVTAVSAGGERSFAITEDKKVWGWGENLLGNGSTDPSYLPTEISGLYGAISISTGYSHTLALIPPPNLPPTANANGPYSVNEGRTVTVNGSGYDPDNDALTYAWDLDNNGTFETSGQNPIFSAVGKNGPSSPTVNLRVCDDKDACDTDPATVNITNVAPDIATISASTNPIIINSSTNASARFTDPAGTLDAPYAIEWDWGDGSVEPSYSVSEPGTLSKDHAYTATGVYEIRLTVTDADGGADTELFQYLSVYSPTPQGLFSAGQKYTSPAGTYLQYPSATGNVMFGLSYKYQRDVPVGNRQFTMDFKTANFEFNAETISSFVISNGVGTLRGTGTITNRSGEYDFLVVGKEGADMIRIQIKDSEGNVIYDTQLGDPATAIPATPVTAGNVLAHE